MKIWTNSDQNPILFHFLPIAFGCKRALQEIVTFKEQQILGTQRQLSAILRLENENLDLFWLEFNPISFFAHCIFSDTFTEHYCFVCPLFVFKRFRQFQPIFMHFTNNSLTFLAMCQKYIPYFLQQNPLFFGVQAGYLFFLVCIY